MASGLVKAKAGLWHEKSREILSEFFVGSITKRGAAGLLAATEPDHRGADRLILHGRERRELSFQGSGKSGRCRSL
jgi:hypothetical protein